MVHIKRGFSQDLPPTAHLAPSLQVVTVASKPTRKALLLYVPTQHEASTPFMIFQAPTPANPFPVLMCAFPTCTVKGVMTTDTTIQISSV